jgi:hypothetical protein
MYRSMRRERDYVKRQSAKVEGLENEIRLVREELWELRDNPKKDAPVKELEIQLDEQSKYIQPFIHSPITVCAVT